MIEQKLEGNQLPVEIKPVFDELQVLRHLKQAGIKKKLGFTWAYLFQLIFVLIFHQKNWFQLLESKKADSYPAKDAVYRFLNHSAYAWRAFLTSLSTAVVHKMTALISTNRITAFVVDDSMFERNRSKKVELLARFKDHATGAYYKGFRMLTLGWTDGHSFVPLDFSLLSSLKSSVCGLATQLDKRTNGYKRRLESLLPAPQVIPDMIKRALRAGVTAPYVLMDSWFTQAPLITALREQGLDVIGMVKNDNKRYLVNHRRLSLNELYYAATPVQGARRDILRIIRTELNPGLPVLVVFVRHRSHKKEWLALLSTDLTLVPEEIIRIYRMRWDIEVFFKCTKSLLRLQKEFQGRSYDLLISHTTIVFARYMVLAWQHRTSTDARTLGGLFYELCDEVAALDWVAALQQLFEILTDVAEKANKKITKLIQRQLQQWIAGLPSYIKAYLPISC